MGMNRDWQGLNVLIVGCGSIGKRHARIISALGVKKILVYDPNPAQIDSLLSEMPFLRACESFDSGLRERPDAVFLCTPPQLHVPQAIMAIESGCNVFTEKPLSDSLDGIEQLSRLVDGSGKKFMVGFCFRYHKGLRKAKQMLDEGLIGRLVSIRSLMGEYLPEIRPDYLNMFLAKTSGAFDLIHDIDLALWYGGGEAADVKCIYGSYSGIGIKSPDIAEILIGFRNRCVASVHLDFFQKPRRRQIELIGTQGTIIVEFGRWEKCAVSIYNDTDKKWVSETMDTARDDMFRDEDSEFLRAITDNSQIACAIEEGVKSIKVVLMAQGKMPLEHTITQ